MAIEVRSGRIDIPSGTGVRAASRTFLLDNLPRTCHVGMSGYRATYTNSDHHIKTLEVDLSCGSGMSEFGPAVFVTARLHLRDKNGDDPFSGFVEFVLFVDTDRPRPLDPNIINAGVERWNS